jgi:ankyrin repeat protein
MGTDIAAEDKYRLMALHWAARDGHVAVVRLLLEKGADVTVEDKRGSTALDLAADNGHEAVAELHTLYS